MWEMSSKIKRAGVTLFTCHTGSFEECLKTRLTWAWSNFIKHPKCPGRQSSSRWLMNVLRNAADTTMHSVRLSLCVLVSLRNEQRWSRVVHDTRVTCVWRFTVRISVKHQKLLLIKMLNANQPASQPVDPSGNKSVDQQVYDKWNVSLSPVIIQLIQE